MSVISFLSQAVRSRRLVRSALLAATLALAACAQPGPDHPPGTPFDPNEQVNRKIHAFNKSVDRGLIRPVARGYSSFMPDDIETLIGRFSDNLSLPGMVVNNLLQGNVRGAGTDAYRFLVNTGLGLGGFFDPASEVGIPAATDTDFGQTLHVWGAPQGPYVEALITGPSTRRDWVGRWVDRFLDPMNYVLPNPESYYATGAKLADRLSERGRYSDTIDSILYDSADSYAAGRSIYLQKRNFELGITGGGSADPYGDPYDDPYDQ